MIHPGYVYMVDFGSQDRGTEERGLRPALCVSSDLHNQVNNSAVFVPLTKQTNKAHWHENVLVNVTNFDKPSVAMCSHVREIDYRYVQDEIGWLHSDEFNVVITTLTEITLERRM